MKRICLSPNLEPSAHCVRENPSREDFVVETVVTKNSAKPVMGYQFLDNAAFGNVLKAMKSAFTIGVVGCFVPYVAKELMVKVPTVQVKAFAVAHVNARVNHRLFMGADVIG